MKEASQAGTYGGCVSHGESAEVPTPCRVPDGADAKQKQAQDIKGVWEYQKQSNMYFKNKKACTTLNDFWWWVAFLQDDVCCFLLAVWHAAPHCAPLDPIQHMNMGNTAGIRISLDNLHISLWCDKHRRAVLLVVISHQAPPCNWCPACGGWLAGGGCSSSWIAGSAIHLQVREIPAREKARMILN